MSEAEKERGGRESRGERREREGGGERRERGGGREGGREKQKQKVMRRAGINFTKQLHSLLPNPDLL